MPWIAISNGRRSRLQGHGLLAAALKDNEISRKQKQRERRSAEPRECLQIPARQAPPPPWVPGCPQLRLRALQELEHTQSSSTEPKHIVFSIVRQSERTLPSREHLQSPFLSSEVESHTHRHCQKEKNMSWNMMGKTTLYIRRTGCSRGSKTPRPKQLVSEHLLTALQAWNRCHPGVHLSMQHLHLVDFFHRNQGHRNRIPCQH